VFFSFLIAAWQEENLFRGYLTGYLKKRFSSEETVILQALIYSLAHLGFYPWQLFPNLIISFIFAFLLGLVLGFLKLTTKSQIPGFICHGMIDMALLLRIL
jgi:membrane protease YdiL (CAAX protease family)